MLWVLLRDFQFLGLEVEPLHPLGDQLDGSCESGHGQSPVQQLQGLDEHDLRILDLTRVEQHLQHHSNTGEGGGVRTGGRGTGAQTHLLHNRAF